ncbi:MAG: NAD-dependent protein deacylase [Alphaproteobacteria bacterium]|nr:MAG: NAD-dependent protein deacylase [Alphaproteobacteria bacterium]
MRVVVLTGAGISAESGIRTFRGSDGLWEGHHIEDVAAPEGFRRNPELVYRFYNDRRRQLLLPEIQPNAAHLALARLEERLGDDFLLVTQNIDDLHKRAGSQRVLPMHGELRKARCSACLAQLDWDRDFDAVTKCGACGESGNLRPHVVWFGEMPLYMDDIYVALSQCDVFAAIGTSGNVYPAAGFVDVARKAGAQSFELNLEKSLVHNAFAERRYGKATEIVPRWVDDLISEEYP